MQLAQGKCSDSTCVERSFDSVSGAKHTTRTDKKHLKKFQYVKSIGIKNIQKFPNKYQQHIYTNINAENLKNKQYSNIIIDIYICLESLTSIMLKHVSHFNGSVYIICNGFLTHFNTYIYNAIKMHISHLEMNI